MSESETNSETVVSGVSLSELSGRAWWWLLVRGILAVGFGVITLLWPGASILVLALVFGAYALVEGAVAAGHAIASRRTMTNWGWLLAQGVLSVLAGLAALILPGLVAVFGTLIVLWTIAIWNVTHGVSGLYSAAGAARGSAKTWGIVAGALSIVFGIVLGVVILVTPGSAILGFVWLVGVSAIAFGIMLVATSIQVRAARS